MTFEILFSTSRTSRRQFIVLLALALFGSAFSRAMAASVELTWNPSPDDDIVAYVVYYGTQSGVYTDSYTFSDVSDAILPDLQPGATYYFALAALNVYGVESDLSNEATCTVPDPTPIGLQAQGAQGFQAVELTWNPGYGDEAVAYNVYSGTQSGVYTNFTTFFYVDDVIIDGLVAGATNYFAVTAVDAYGVESPLSNETSYAVAMPAPLVLQMQTFTDQNGQPYLMELSVNAAVSGSWEIDWSTDLQNWSAYYSGYGYGTGHDVDAYVSLDLTQPQMFFRLMNY